MTCVYWEDRREASEGRQSHGEMRWSTEGCWVSFAHENYTVCSCSHLSTFALIMQIAEVKAVGPPACAKSLTCIISVLCIGLNTDALCLLSLHRGIRFWNGLTECA